ncbi:MAG: type II toxin-antitoxin system RelE/ParE family toxin [bacterium]|nr:type II toxin-antitoxin system RelE/ParE family toxin [bacterium]
MEIYEVEIPKRVQKQLQAVPLPWRDRIKRAITLLEEGAFEGEKMHGIYMGSRKIRVWPYRIYYRVDKSKKMVFILEVKHRGSTDYK